MKHQGYIDRLIARWKDVCKDEDSLVDKIIEEVINTEFDDVYPPDYCIDVMDYIYNKELY